jgi:hypothetical protein
MTDLIVTESCPLCGKALSWEKDHCPACAAYVGAPNVREAKQELTALQTRYLAAKEDNHKRGCETATTHFADVVAAQSVAVVNLWPDFLMQMLNSDTPLYSSYCLQTEAETRLAAKANFDRERLGTEGTLFGIYAPSIRYAALSLDGRGLVSYGSCSVTLRDSLCRNIGSLLEENSYTFVRRHRLLPGDTIPLGYRAAWDDRHYLATAKLATKITINSGTNKFAHTLLFSEGDRATDEFIEVHLFGMFNRQAFVASQVPRFKKRMTRSEKAVLGEIHDYLRHLNIPCIAT